MEFNPKKCYTMCVWLKWEPPVAKLYFCAGKLLENVESHSYLGVKLGNKLRWKDHIKQICNAANNMLGLVRRTFWYCMEEHQKDALRNLGPA